MTNLTKLSLAASLVASLAACGDNTKVPDAGIHDGPTVDAGFPAAPTLGMQIDRMGRPAVNTALNSLLTTDAVLKKAKKDAYNQAATPAMWKTTVLNAAVPADTVLAEFAGQIGLFDVLDQGVVGITGAGCGNAVQYMGPPSATSYLGLASLLADDELYVDTAKLTCNFYLSLEVEVAASVPHSQCGGRTPLHDVIDTSYSLLAAGVGGFEVGSFAPKIGDGVAAHTDVSNDTFPFLGTPH